MKENSPAYLWYPKDALSSGRIMALKDLEELWYRRALDQAWLNEGIPSNPEEFAAWVGRGCTVEAAEKIIRIFFEPHKKNSDFVVNPRQEEERRKFRKKCLQRSEAGKVSGAKRREKRDLAVEQPFDSVQTKAEQKRTIPIPIPIKERVTNVTLSTVREIFAYWQTALSKNDYSLTKKRQERIRARLKEGWTVEQLKAVIDSASKDPFYCGKNDRNREFLDIPTIFKDADKIEYFLFGNKKSLVVTQTVVDLPTIREDEAGGVLRGRNPNLPPLRFANAEAASTRN